MRLAGKVAIVTGGSRGIGRAIVQALAHEGARVAFVWNRRQDAAEQLLQELSSQGHEAMALQADVRVPQAAQAVVEQVLDRWEQVDILVNNAGIIQDGLFASMDRQQWQEVIDTNLGGVYNFTHAVVRPMMSRRQGRIINLSSLAARYGNRGQVNYAASKAGIEGLTRCLAKELGRRGVTVNAIAPGMIETEMSLAVRNVAGEQITQRIPLGRIGQAEEVARVAVFLASDDASYITGQVIGVDGGLSLGGW